MTAKDLMGSEVVTLKPSHSLEGAARLLARHNIKGAPVVNDEGKCLGMVSKDDLLAALYREEDIHFSSDVEKLFSSGFASGKSVGRDPHVEDIMTRDVVFVSPDDSIEKVCSIMAARRIHRVPVLDANGRIVGIVSATDILSAVASGKIVARA